MDPEDNLRPGVNRGCLEVELVKSPPRHAFWDLEHHPDQANFFTSTMNVKRGRVLSAREISESAWRSFLEGAVIWPLVPSCRP